ncbi:DUF3164 family protein [Pedobacter sp. BS3]|uniref:DUF3164 family protein n=1 Tax=Pedobacter sp. BS3 TaxID=2567937 RepID=UPI0011EBE8C6|nr:DUF3164 family protein [Pedobacter sp. BS3]TZF81794.1 DUF3164 family protein [Pedobacter sp. BS3]
METQAKQLSELTSAELKALLAKKEADEAAERKQKREQYEVLRDETVTNIVNKAAALKDALKDFKAAVWSDLETLYKLLQEHSQRHADGKGSFTLETSCSNFKVQYKRQDNTRFDERATQAERHILDFLTSQFGDDSATSKLVRKLLERKKGQLDKDQVLHLISMKDEFDNENWRKGIELLQESIVPGETRYYAQFFVKSQDGENWMPIVLDFAKL